MDRAAQLVWLLCLLRLLVAAAAVKVKVVMHSEQDDSKTDEEEMRTDSWKQDTTVMPFIKAHHKTHRIEPEKPDFEEAKPDVAKSRQQHPNELIFPLIYKQSHINSMFKFGETWYTWSTEKRTDGSRATNYYVCYDEPKRCDDVGWERTDAPPKCAFQIDSLLPEDRACLNPFGQEPRAAGACDGADQMKVSDMVRECGPRVRSLWRFVRVGRRPPAAAKPADVNSLICEDEEECFITIEYRIHHDRITFSLHEPTRGQTFKSALKRDVAAEEEPKAAAAPSERPRGLHRPKARRPTPDEPAPRAKKYGAHARPKAVEGKGVLKERDDSGYSRHHSKNKIRLRDDVPDDLSE